MAICTVCSDARAKEINRWLLTGRKGPDVAKEFGINVQILRWHRRKHLPYWNPRRPKPVTVGEELAQLKYELSRLAMPQSGEPIGAAISAVTAKRQVLELEARLEGKLDAHHRKLILNSREPEGSYRVKFENGRARTVEVEK
jgi:hypothetical protein